MVVTHAHLGVHCRLEAVGHGGSIQSMFLESSRLSWCVRFTKVSWFTRVLSLALLMFLSFGCTGRGQTDSSAPECQDEALEAQSSSPMILEIGSHPNFVVCPDVTDRFLVASEAGQVLKIEINSSDVVSAVFEGQSVTGRQILFTHESTGEPSELTVEGGGARYRIDIKKSAARLGVEYPSWIPLRQGLVEDS